jgi:hypothetical protein
VPNGYVVSQNAWCLAVERMDTAVILYVSAVANFYIVDISADDSIEPDGAVIAHLYISCDNSSFAEVAVFSKTWCRHACQFLDNCHFQYNILVQR